MADNLLIGRTGVGPAHASLAGLSRQVLGLAAPTTLLAVAQSLAQLFETWLAARQGTAALAGWAVVLPFALLLQMASAGAMGGGVVSAIARALGAGQPDKAAALALHAILIAVAAGLLFAVVLAGFPHAVFRLVGGQVAAEAAAPYAVWLFGLGAIPVWLANTFASVLRGAGRHALAARVMLTTTLALPLVAWVLVESLGMGLPGLGLAFALMMMAATVGQALVVFRGGVGFQFRWRVPIRAALFGRILSVGLVACMLVGIANLTTILVTARVQAHGPAAVAAYGIAARLEFLMVPLAFGVGSALTALVGQAAGAGDWARARRTAWTGALMALMVTAPAGLFAGTCPGVVAGMFSSDAEVVAVATRALSLIGPALPAFGTGMAFYFAAMGADRMKWPVAAGLARAIVAVGGGWLLADACGWELEGQFLAVALGLGAYGFLTAAAFRPSVWPGAR